MQFVLPIPSKTGGCPGSSLGGYVEAKAICDFAQLPDGELFAQVAKGLGLIHENACTIRDCAQALRLRGTAGDCRGAEILKLTAEEEASKFLILLDAVRCPRKSNDDKQIFARQLDYFYKHLARGIYAEYYKMDFGYDFKDVRGFVETERTECYLDGPDFLCWVMPNCIRSRRENKIYVDYLRGESGNFWNSPANEPLLTLEFGDSPLDNRIFEIIDALYEIIQGRPDILEVIASFWRPIRMQETASRAELMEQNSHMIAALRHGVKEFCVAEELTSSVTNGWLFPLYDLKLLEHKVQKDQIERILKAEKEAFWRSVI